MTTVTNSGVWLSDIPLDANEGVPGDTLLRIELDATEDELKQFEWIEEGKPYREWQVPAVFINSRATIRIEKES